MSFSALLPWFDAHGRRLPFRGTRDPYRVWLSETMLQQTRTETVATYYQRFLGLFPTVAALAVAEEAEVLKAWEGLGYYSRARNLHRAAKIIHFEWQDQFPADEKKLRSLPGVGDYTCAAVLSIAFGKPLPALDGNLTRVLARVYGIAEDVTLATVKARLRTMAAEDIDPQRPGDWNQALMDIGALLCTPGAPACSLCPLSQNCAALAQGCAALLPVHPRPKAPLQVPLAVAFLRFENRVLVLRRREKLLQGLYVFYLLEGSNTPEALEADLRGRGICPLQIRPAGEGRHVFTHRVWLMRYYDVLLQEEVPLPEGVYLPWEALAALPFPTAMRGARAALKSCMNAADHV